MKYCITCGQPKYDGEMLGFDFRCKECVIKLKQKAEEEERKEKEAEEKRIAAIVEAQVQARLMAIENKAAEAKEEEVKEAEVKKPASMPKSK